MTINLISDRPSLSILNFLLGYLPEFFSKNVHFNPIQPILEPKDLWTWEDLFSAGKNARSLQNKAAADDYYIVLFSGENEHNWFASFDNTDHRIGFVQVSGWKNYGITHGHYAVAYHLVAILTAMKFFGDKKDAYSFYHNTTQGCMFDFTGVKEEVSFKLKSAHICKQCLTSMAKKANGSTNDLLFLRGVKKVLEGVRESLFEVNWATFFKTFEYKLHIKDDLTMELEVDRIKIPIPLGRGRESVIFMMLLKYKDGLSYKDFEKPKILKEYQTLYHRYFVNNSDLKVLIKQSYSEIEKKTYRANLQSMISKMKKKLEKTLVHYPEIQKELVIQGGKGPLVIPINRNLLEYDKDQIQFEAS